MNFLIVMPQVTKDETRWYQFPIGMAYVSASMKKAGFSVITLNLNYKKEPVEEIIKRVILKEKIDVVATAGLSTQYKDIVEILDCVKNLDTNIITMVGGGIITGDAEAAMLAMPNADYGMIGEGEKTACELAAYLENPDTKEIEEIDGIIYYHDGQLKINKPREEIMDLDTIPWPDYEGFEYEKVLQNKPSDHLCDGLDLKTAFLCCSRSCVYQCTFCFHSSGKRYRQRSIDNIFEEVDWLLSKYEIEAFYIVDELFASKFERVAEFCRRIQKYNIKWVVQLRVDIVTRELLQILKESNCISVGFGLESANNRILKSMRKNITVEQIDSALQLCQEVGVLGFGGFIFGDLEENTESVEDTLTWWKNHPQYSIALSLIRVYPGSYLYQVACERELIKNKVQFLQSGCPSVNVSKLSDQEYAAMARRLDSIAVHYLTRDEGSGSR